MATTLKAIGAALKDADRTSQKVFSELKSIGQRSQQLLTERDKAHAEIAALASEISTAGSDPKRLDDLLEKLARARQRFYAISQQLVSIWGEADHAISPLSDLTNAAVCLLGGLRALEENWFSLPDSVTKPIYEAASKTSLKLTGVPA